MPFRLSNDAVGLTAGQCIKGRWCLVINCTGCGRHERFPQKTLARFAPDTPLFQIARRLVCTGCRGTEGVVALGNADWHPGKLS